MVLEVIAWPIFYSFCFCRLVYSSARQSASNNPRPGFVRGFSFPLSRAPERARIAAELAGRPDVFPAPSPPVLRRFRAFWTRAAGERDTAAKLCTAYNTRTGLITRFAVRPTSTTPCTFHALCGHSHASYDVLRCFALHAINRSGREGSPVGQGQKGSPDRAIFGFDSGLFFHSVFGRISRRFAVRLLMRPIVA